MPLGPRSHHHSVLVQAQAGAVPRVPPTRDPRLNMLQLQAAQQPPAQQAAPCSLETPLLLAPPSLAREHAAVAQRATANAPAAAAMEMKPGPAATAVAAAPAGTSAQASPPHPSNAAQQFGSSSGIGGGGDAVPPAAASQPSPDTCANARGGNETASPASVPTPAQETAPTAAGPVEVVAKDTYRLFIPSGAAQGLEQARLLTLSTGTFYNAF